MQIDAIVTLVVLGCMFVLLVTEWVPPGVTGLLTIAALAASSVLPSEEAAKLFLTRSRPVSSS